MAITRAQTGTAATTTGTGTVTPTLPAGATAGNIIIALVAYNSAATATSFSSGGGATKQVENNTGSACGSAIFTKVAAGGETNIGAFTLATGTRDCYGLLLEYSGLTGIAAQQTQSTGSSTASTTPNTAVSAASATAPGLAVSVIAHINALQSATVARMAGDTSTGGTPTKIGEAASGAATAAQRVTGRAVEVLYTGSGVIGHQGTITTGRAYSGSIMNIQEAIAAATQVPTHLPFIPQRRSF